MTATTFSIGRVELCCFTDAEVAFSVPFSTLLPEASTADWQEYQQRYPAVFATPTTWNVHVGSHLIRSGGTTILVDTGIGPEPSQRLGGRPGRLMEELKQAGVGPDDIDVVFVSHSHADHIGWNLNPNGSPRFPKARFVLSQKEWDWLPSRVETQAPGSAEIERNLFPLRDLESLELLDGDSVLTDHVTAILTPGHTPGHMSLLISSDGEKAVLTGDAIVHPAQVTHPEWHLAMDFDKALAVETRQRLLDRIESEGLTLVACHFPSPGWGQVIRLDSRRYWQAT